MRLNLFIPFAFLILSTFQIGNGEIQVKRVKRIVGGSQAEEPIPEEDSALPDPTLPTSEASSAPSTLAPPVSNTAATINGIQNEDSSYSFLGIKYAFPPTGKYRFQRPRMMKLKGVVNATKYGPPCPQPNPENNNYIGEEDCLYLNVFTPKISNGNGTDSKKPVLFWIHGGHFRRGSAAQYNPKKLVEKGIVVVTIQYRLGSLGFLSIGRKELPGNVGLFDIATALRWVTKYIHYFGGDSKRIVAGGQGSGASCATMLALSNQANQISGVFAMSGTPVSPFAVDKKENETAKGVAAFNGCKVEEGVKFVRCMQKLPLETIMNADNSLQNERMKSREFPKNLASLNGPAPNEEAPDDTRFLPSFIVESPLEAVKKGKFPPIPLLTGVTKEETSSGVKGSFLDQVTNKLLSPSFLKNGLFNNALEANTGLYTNKTVNPQLQSLFANNNFLGFFSEILTSSLSDIEKVIKHTTDAFFNLPAFVTSHLWSKKSKAYLYSFEHNQKETTGQQFLPGLPLAKKEKTEEKKGPSHGDDLIYLFDLQSLNGTPINNSLTSEADKSVKELFTFIVAEFVKSGAPKVIGGEPSWPPFNGNDGNYMIIAEKPRLAKNFQKCQMGMWTGDANILGSDECSYIGGAAKAVTDTIGSAGSTLLKGVSSITKAPQALSNLGGQVKPIADTVTKPLGTVLNPLGGLFGGNKKATKPPSSATPSEKQPTTTKKPSGGLLGFGGLG